MQGVCRKIWTFIVIITLLCDLQPTEMVIQQHNSLVDLGHVMITHMMVHMQPLITFLSWKKTNMDDKTSVCLFHGKNLLIRPLTQASARSKDHQIQFLVYSFSWLVPTIDMNALDANAVDDDDDGVLLWGCTHPLAILQTESVSVRIDLARKQHTQDHTQIFTHALKCQMAFRTEDKCEKNDKNAKKKLIKPSLMHKQTQ